MLDREAILTAVDLPIDTIDVPEWGGQVRVRGIPFADKDYLEFINRDLKVADEVLTRAEELADAFIQALKGDVAPDKRLVERLARTEAMFRRSLRRVFAQADDAEENRRGIIAAVICCVVDENGERIFDYTDEDEKLLRSKNFHTLNRIALEAARLSERLGPDVAATFPGGAPLDPAAVPAVDQPAEPPSV